MVEIRDDVVDLMRLKRTGVRDGFGIPCVQSQGGLWNIILKNYLCELEKLEKAKSHIFQLQ